MTKTQKHAAFPPHTPVSRRGGCKVSWATYATRKEAEDVSKWAQAEAYRKAELGYDFGYQAPGSIAEVKEGFEVCLP